MASISPWSVLPGIVILILLGTVFIDGLKADEAKNPTAPKDLRVNKTQPIRLHPVGVVKQEKDRARLEIKPEFAPGLKGIEDFSHLWVCYWFHRNDRPEERATLQVHPRRDPANPLTGVFATRAPVRPNLIGITACRLLKVRGNVLEVEGLDGPGRLPHPGPEALHPRRGRHPRGHHPGVGEAFQAPGRLASSLVHTFLNPPTRDLFR